MTNQKPKAVVKKAAVKKETGFEWVSVPKDAIVLAVDPRDVSKSIPQVASLFESQGFEIRQKEAADFVSGRPETPEEMATMCYNSITTFPADMQNKIVFNLLAALRSDRQKDLENAEMQRKEVDQKLGYVYGVMEEFNTLINGGVTASGAKMLKH